MNSNGTADLVVYDQCTSFCCGKMIAVSGQSTFSRARILHFADSIDPGEK